MLIIGLTGSIATGKSTVSTLLSSPPYSLPLIDADILAREVVEPGTPAYRQIVAYFGPKVPDLLLPVESSSSSSPSSSSLRPLNRPALSRRVFGSSAPAVHDRSVLNGIVHPAVRRALIRALLRHYLRGAWAVVVDVPLLFEAGLDVWCGVVIVVGLREREEQVRRLRERARRKGENGGEGITQEEAQERVGSQMGVLEKVAMVVWRNRWFGWGVPLGGGGRGMVVWNDDGVRELEGEVKRVYGLLRAGSPNWWTRLCWLVPPVGVLAGLLSVGRNWWDRRAWKAQKKKL